MTYLVEKHKTIALRSHQKIVAVNHVE